MTDSSISQKFSEPIHTESTAKRHWSSFIGPPGSRLRRTKYLLTGIVVPGFCITAGLAGTNATIEQPWQSGEIAYYVAMLLRWPTLFVFLPLILYSMFCLAWWLIRPRSAQDRFIRFGIYTGAILAGQFLVMVILTTGPISPLAALICGTVLAIICFLIGYIIRRSKRFTILHLLGLTTLVAIVVFAIRQVALHYDDDFVDFVIVPFLYAFVAGPTLNFITYCRASIELARDRNDRQPVTRAMLATFWMAWLVGWAASWKIAVELMLIEYAKLPTNNPNCYVSSAAAGGHARLVGTVRGPRPGDVANLQMRRLKFLELALAAAAPAVHSVVRLSYDRYGPALARVCRSNVWFADATYLILKPVEFTAEGIRWVANIPPSHIRRIYSSRN